MKSVSNPEDEEYAKCVKRGQELFNGGRYAEASVSFDRALQLLTVDPDVWAYEGIIGVVLINKSAALIESKRYEDALDCVDRGLELKPTCGDGWRNKGGALMYLGRSEEALPCLEKALALGSDCSESVARLRQKFGTSSVPQLQQPQVKRRRSDWRPSAPFSIAIPSLIALCLILYRVSTAAAIGLGVGLLISLYLHRFTNSYVAFRTFKESPSSLKRRFLVVLNFSSMVMMVVVPIALFKMFPWMVGAAYLGTLLLEQSIGPFELDREINERERVRTETGERIRRVLSR